MISVRVPSQTILEAGSFRSTPVPEEATSQTRILFITAVPPHLGVGGGFTAARSLIDTLREPPLNSRVEVFPLRPAQPRLSHRFRQVLALAKSFGSPLPSKSLFDFARSAARRLKTTNFQRYAAIMINGGELYFLADYLPSGVPIIGLCHNLESALYAAQTEPLRQLPIIGRYFRNDLYKLKNVELAGLRRFGRVICLSAADASKLRAMVPTLRTIELPTTFSYTPHSRRPGGRAGRPLRLGFLAKYSWWPNIEAVDWMLDKVLPDLPPGSAELHLYGPGAHRFQGKHPALRSRGFVQDLNVVWEESDIVVCPMHSGSGINIKFIEAIYNRCPVIATPYSARGLPSFEDPAVVFLGTSEEWVEFLSSKRAESLAQKTPSEKTRHLFSRNAGSSNLARFLNL